MLITKNLTLITKPHQNPPAPNLKEFNSKEHPGPPDSLLPLLPKHHSGAKNTQPCGLPWRPAAPHQLPWSSPLSRSARSARPRHRAVHSDAPEAQHVRSGSGLQSVWR